MIRPALAAAVLALAAAAAPPSCGDPARAVVVLPFEGGAEADESTAAQAARDLVEARLAERPDLRVVEREALDRLLAERALLGLTDAAGAARVGGLLAARVAVTGTVGRVSGRWRFHLQAFSVPEGALLATAQGEGEDPSLETSASTAADLLATRLAGAPAPVGLREDRRAAASAAYLRGLGLHRAGRPAEAIGAFLEARRLAARFVETRYWMGVAFARIGRPDQARVAFERFLAEAPSHALAAEARCRLDRLDAAPPPSRADVPGDWTLYAAFVSGEPSAEREKGLEERLRRRDLTAAEIEATLDVVDAWNDVGLLLAALARVAPDRFLARVAQEDALRGAPGALDLVRRVLEPDRADALGRALLDPSPRRRAEAIAVVGFLRAHRPWGMALESPDVRARLDDAAGRAADRTDPAVSLPAILLLSGEPEAIGRWGGRILDASYPPAYRASLVAALGRQVVRDPALVDGVVDLLAHEDEGLRAAAVAALGWLTAGPDGGSPEERRTWTERATAAQARAGALARRLLDERRFPDDADLLWPVLGPPRPADAALARRLLASPAASERAVGACLAGSDPSLLEERGAALLDDEDPRVRAFALATLSRFGDVRPTARLLLAWWRRSEEAGPAAAHEFHSGFGVALRVALRTLQSRLPSTPGAPPPPAPADLAGWEAAFR